MRAYRLTVFSPFHKPPAVLRAEVLRVEVDQPVEWVKAHADEIAARAVTLPICALWVEELKELP